MTNIPDIYSLFCQLFFKILLYFCLERESIWDHSDFERKLITKKNELYNKKEANKLRYMRWTTKTKVNRRFLS